MPFSWQVVSVHINHRTVYTTMFNWIKNLFINKSDDYEKSIRINSITIDSVSNSDWIRIIPIGEFPNHPNGAHTITTEHLEQMAANFNSEGDELLFDYDHGSIFKADSKAAGWSPDVEVRDDGLYAKYPEFTNTAKESIEDREYRFFSPVYYLNAEDKQGNKIGAKLHSVGLTNTPYMDVEIDHIGNSLAASNGLTENNDTDKRTDMKLNKENLKKLGLSEDATEEQINEAIANSEFAKPSGEEAGASGEGAEAGASEPGKDGDDTPKVNSDEANEELLAKVNSLETKLAEREKAEQTEKATALVNSAIEAGKILPAHKDAWIRAANADFDATKESLDGIKANSAMPGKVTTNNGDNPEGGNGSGNDEDAFANAVNFLNPLVKASQKSREA